MSLRDRLDEALDRRIGQAGEVAIEADGRRAEVAVTDVDRLGVRVRGVKVHRAHDREVQAEAAALPERLRAIPEPLGPVEVDPALGGATLRTKPGALRDREFFEVEVRGTRDVEVRRYRAEVGDRKPIDWTMTREQLGRLLDQLDGDEG